MLLAALKKFLVWRRPPSGSAQCAPWENRTPQDRTPQDRKQRDRRRHARSGRARHILQRLHSEIELALWAGLLALLAWFALFVVPHMPEAHARAESQRLHEIEAMDNLYCEKFGSAQGTPQRRQCLLNLGAYRAQIMQRMLADQESPF